MKTCLSDQVEGEELAELVKLHDSVYEQANNWFTSLKDNMKTQILGHFGHLPSKDADPQVSEHKTLLYLLRVIPNLHSKSLWLSIKQKILG